MTGEKIPILVTGVGGDIGFNITRCLKDTEYDIYLLGCDIDSYAIGRTKVEKFFIAPKASNETEYLNFIDNIVEEYKIKYIYPSTEPEIACFNRNRKHFENIGVVVFINNLFILENFLDKYKTINFLRENKFPFPQTFLIEDYDNQLDFPLLIKKRESWGGRGLIIVNDSKELEFYKSRVNNAIVQEYIGNKNEEYTVGVFSGSNNIYSICFRRQLGYGSMSRVVELVHNKEMENVAKKIAVFSQLEGSLNIQFIKRGDEFVPFEINPRISSTVYFRHYFGFQDVKWWLDIKENKTIEYILKYKKGVGVRTVGEVFFDLEV